MSFKYKDLVLEFDIYHYMKQHLECTPSQTRKWVTSLCPFHDDSTPSFSMNLEHGGWVCFACNKRGDFLKFLQDFHNLNFPDALQIIKEGVQ